MREWSCSLCGVSVFGISLFCFC